MSILNRLKHLQNDQIEAASRVAFYALQNDPLSFYYYRHPIERKIKTLIRYEYTILLGILSGEVYTIPSNIKGVAIWNAYGIKDQTIGEQSKEIIRKLRKVRRKMFSDRRFSKRYGITLEICNSLHNEHANFPHWNLTMLTVDPLRQGEGYASLLIRLKLREIDKQNLPCYLQTQNENNVFLFEHFGFKLVGEIKFPNSNVYSYGMLRNKKKS